jgi:predicted transcriptional regulator
MSTITMSIEADTHRTLQDLAARTAEPVEVVLKKALEEYRRKRFWDETNAAYAALRADPQAWQEELAERALTEGTLADGLDKE